MSSNLIQFFGRITSKEFSFVNAGDASIGRGSFGVVFRGEDRTTKKRVAVKVLIVNDDLLEREIKIHQRLQHPNVVQLLDYGEATFVRSPLL